MCLCEFVEFCRGCTRTIVVDTHRYHTVALKRGEERELSDAVGAIYFMKQITLYCGNNKLNLHFPFEKSAYW